jgi:hypothetical protein
LPAHSEHLARAIVTIVMIGGRNAPDGNNKTRGSAMQAREKKRAEAGMLRPVERESSDKSDHMLEIMSPAWLICEKMTLAPLINVWLPLYSLPLTACALVRLRRSKMLVVALLARLNEVP